MSYHNIPFSWADSWGGPFDFFSKSCKLLNCDLMSPFVPPFNETETEEGDPSELQQMHTFSVVPARWPLGQGI